MTLSKLLNVSMSIAENNDKHMKISSNKYNSSSALNANESGIESKIHLFFCFIRVYAG